VVLVDGQDLLFEWLWSHQLGLLLVCYGLGVGGF